MRKKILDYYEQIHAPYLHAHSEAGTEFLLQELAIRNSDKIIELGFGTGGTLVKIKARHPSVSLYGIEKSKGMCDKARARLSFCGIQDVTILELPQDGNIPFGEGTIDKIYAESVLAIQDENTLERLLKELYRILRSGGQLVINETVWLPEIQTEEIFTINNLCKDAFGIPQSNAEYPYKNNWEGLLRRIGFSHVKSKTVFPCSNGGSFHKKELLSKLFTQLGKFSAYRPKMLLEFNSYKKRMGSIYKNKRYMEGVLFVATK